MKVLMLGPARNVMGGISSVINNYFSAGIDKKIGIQYIATVVDGNVIEKMMVCVKALLYYIVSVIHYDIIHVHMASGASFLRKSIFILLAVLFRRKVIIHLHGAKFEVYYENSGLFLKKYIRWIMKTSSCIIVLSKSWEEVIRKIVNHPNIRVLYNSVFLPNSPMPKDYTDLNVTFLGRVGERKGIYDMIDIIPKLKEKYNNLCIYVGGDGELDKFRRLCQERGISGSVQILGWIHGKEKEDLLEKTTVYMLPSYHEGLPMSILEAMSYQIPIISTNVGGIPEVVKDDYNGYLIEPGNIEKLYKKLDQILSSKKLRKVLGINAYKTICARFNAKTNINLLYDLYQSII